MLDLPRDFAYCGRTWSIVGMAVWRYGGIESMELWSMSVRVPGTGVPSRCTGDWLQ
jgi:hypothetical protein